MKCYSCGGLMEKGVELIITSNGKTIPQNIMKCKKCGKFVVTIDEYEKVRKELNPSIFNRIRKLFKIRADFVEISRGRVL